jgi:hypothetical protein
VPLFRCDQQPFIDVVPVEPNVPVIVVPVVGDVPGQGVAEMLGSGMPMVVLSPGVPTSVAPSGIVLPLPMVPSPSPAAGLIAVPDAVPPVPIAAGLHVVAIDEPDIAPPPSKVELDPAIPVPVIIPVLDPEIPLLDVVMPVLEPAIPVLDVAVPEHNVPLASGLSPPVLSSVAPSGMPIGPDAALKFIVPSGDVAPMPGVGPTCAKLLPQPRRKMTPVMVRALSIEASSVCATPGRMRWCHFRRVADA